MRKNQCLTSLFALFCLIVSVGLMTSCQTKTSLTSPDKQISVTCTINEKGEAVYAVTRNGEVVILPSKLGVIMDTDDFSKTLKLLSVSETKPVNLSYTMIQGKKKECTYSGNEQRYTFANPSGKKMDIIFRVSNDGVAFRYFFPSSDGKERTIKEEITSFSFPKGTKAWMQPMAVAKSGWCRTNPSYEEDYSQNIDAGTASPLGKGWIFPALLNSNNSWVLLTESDLKGDYCGSRLEANPNGSYQIRFPEEVENFPGGGILPHSSASFSTPWRILAIGDLKTITGSTLETDMAEPAVEGDYSWVKPGKSSWSWVMLKDDSTVFEVQKKYIDYAADMTWNYCLVDADWDKKIGYEKLAELSKYAATKNVGLLVWYNSSGDWNDTQYSPKSKLITHEQRVSEFGKLKEMGIKGVKVDFFGGDGQSMIQYYLDLIKDAADAKLMINFHGCTYPRSWHRTYPNLVTMESIKGMEFATFNQIDTDKVPTHGAVIPFTRNVFSPMDFTPMCLHSIPNIQRRTTNVYELATSVLFLSGVTHYAERPEGIATIPVEIKELLKHLPAAWDESKFIDGFPGKLVVMARRDGATWYVVGINGEPTDKTISIDMSFIGKKSGRLITEGADALSYSISDVSTDGSSKMDIAMKPNGGFFMMFN
jgi:hypothetical protein